ncbi:amino acid adenylation domain-containing protein [Candidatus Methylospira mobilis]|uniref:non-ribosomal peptide synthetase n=1 Tax=Candidatus Methylospira mobilis TaxID=1808979 RepID=UPI0028E8087A|nr:non-ribosomal peptide synthetase [Candidatus Methylospira mobilis]WNV06060.1 amino acid adenylation domain-containing protein [Candidatus Methylospira mobilis]
MRYLEESRPATDAHACQNFVELLHTRAHEKPGQTAYVFLGDGEAESGRLSFAELDRRARAIAARLQAMRMNGERALLLYPQGLAYIEAFFGCLYAGVVAVPAYPPTRQHLQRLHGIMRDAAPAAILTTGELLPKLQDSLSMHDGSWLASDILNGGGAAAWEHLSPETGDLAFLQYTSGSTGDPKGVMVSHGNLLANQEAIRQSFGHDEHSTVVGWLPLYHDMGLIGNILQPLYTGSTAILMPPMAFLEKPLRWLQAISTYQATTSGGPNFAYDLCVRKIGAAQKQGLDLSSWRLAFNGSEPVRAATMGRFADAFAECGFQRQRFFPCYGMAETTLFVSGENLTSPQSGTTASVSCGVVAARHEVRIVDPVSRLVCAPGQEGEIWVSGPSVAQGYWKRAEASDEIFRAHIEQDASGTPYLRTGDLGLLLQERLHITGRIKDLIIIRGRNYYPQDIELAATDALEALRSNACAAFPVADRDEEGMVLAAEITRDAMRQADYGAIFASLRSVLAERCELTPTALVLLPPGGVPKTSSGKLRRHACRQAYLNGTLPELARSTHAEGSACNAAVTENRRIAAASEDSEADADAQLLRTALSMLPAAQRAPLVANYLRNAIARLLKVAASAIPADVPLAATGLDSLKRIELKHRADRLLNIDSPLSLFMSDATLEDIAHRVSEAVPVNAEHNNAVAQTFELSPAQLSMWTMQQMEPDSIVYNLHLALRVDGDVDAALLRQAFDELAERHAMLRTRYRSDQGRVTQALLPLSEIPEFFSVMDAQEWTETALQHDMAQRSHTHFDLAGGKVFHATLYRHDHNGQEQTLLLCAHHIAVDLWSALILITELKTVYSALAQGHPAKPNPVGPGYSDYVAHQHRYLNSQACEQDWNYWRQRLAGDLPLLALPTDYPRPNSADYRGAATVFRLNKETARQLKTLAAQQRVSLFTLLLAAYKTLLHRYCRQNDLIVGVPGSGRDQARFAQVVGVFVNPLPLRTHPIADKPFPDYLREVNAALRVAMEHQALPFNVLVDRLQPERSGDHWPVYQTLFVLQQAQTGIADDLVQISLGEKGEPLIWDGWLVQSVALQERVENFDLKLMAAENQDGLTFSFQYRQALFQPATVARLARQFNTLLHGIVETPTACLGDLPLLDSKERRQMLTQWNATRNDYPAHCRLHEFFEEQAATRPDATAVICGEERIAYGELNRRANQLANYLQAVGVTAETTVGLCVERSLNAITGMLAILKAGGVYVPIDPAYPRERIADTLADCGATLLLTHARWREHLPETDAKIICLDRDWAHIATQTHNSAPKLAQASNGAYLIYTSGSTGKAKGVVVSHENAIASMLARPRFYRETVDGFLLLSSFAFDSSIAGIFWTLSQGGRLCLPGEDSYQDTETLCALIARERLTHLLCLPSLYNLLLESGKNHALDMLRTVIVAGEACQPALAAKHYRYLPETSLCNEYGPTEASVWSSAYRIPADTAESLPSIPIGQPIANSRIYVLDSRLNPVPVGVCGEIHIGGAGVARGYFNRPDLTAERFFPDLLQAESGARMYRTGDLARWNADGMLEFIGRSDQQVKIRGFRIELGEIETRLNLHPAVKETAVVVAEDSSGTKRLIAYWVAQDETTAEALRAFLKASLPDYMVPALFIAMEAMPLMPNGKPDRRALPEPDYNALSAKYAAPENAVQTVLAQAWAEVLRVERVGIYDNFFDLGGDSILAIQVAIQAHKAGLSLNPRQIFQHQTVAGLAAALQSATQSEVTETVADSPAMALSRLTRQELDALPLDQADIEDAYPLTPLQEGMLFHSLMAPHSGIYLMQDRFTLKGVLSPELFGQAWGMVIQRHPVLRTCFAWNTASVPHQIVHRRIEPPFDYFDWRERPETEQKSGLDKLLREEREQGFDLERPPLLRLRLIRLKEDRYWAIRSHHHILLDAWCTSLLLMEFKACYDALAAGQAQQRPPASPFRHYIGWLQAQDETAEANFWRGYLAGFEEPTPLVVDRIAHEDPTAEMADIALQLPETVTRQLHDMAQHCRVTLNTLVQGAWAILLSRYSGVRDVLFGITVAGRPAELDHVEETLGLFINGLPLRVAIDPQQPLQAFLQALLRQNLELRQFEYTALTQIREWGGLPSDQELFQHLLTFENAPIDPKLREHSDTFEFTGVEVRTHTNYPITVMVIPEDSLHLQISYQCARFEAPAIERMLAHLRQLLEDIVACPRKRVGELNMLTAPERRQLLLDWNRSEHPYPEPADWVACFEAQAARTPDAIAVSCRGVSLSYRALNERVNRLAGVLSSTGVGPDVLVALLNDRGIEFAVMMFGVFKAGGAYLPLDPAYPDERIAQVLTESRTPFVLAGAAHLPRVRAVLDSASAANNGAARLLSLPELETQGACADAGNPVRLHSAENLAFVIFTSGSTGTPKGAMVEHRGMFNNLITKVPRLKLSGSDIIAQTAGQCFDISVWQHLTALVRGARVEIFSDDIVKEPGLLLKELEARGVTILEAVPSMIQALLDLSDSHSLHSLRWLIACGEAFSPELCRRWMLRFPHIRVLNAYGPAECSDDVSYYEVPEPPAEHETVVPVGRPVHNTRLYLLDARLEPVPVGVPAEICVTGIQVGRGYLHRAELTAEKFLPDPFGPAGDRLYRTGDLGRYREDGSIEFLGRIDHQLKIRGFRIEPAEIELQMLKLEPVEQALVVASKNRRNELRLVAYLVAKADNAHSDAELALQLRAYLNAHLPHYMVPSDFVRLDAMPLSANGKIDRKKLPEPDGSALRESAYVAPTNPTEELLTEIWQEVLEVKRVGIRDNFFDMGGHSLLAVRVLSRVRATFGVEIPLQRLFEAATVEQQAELVEARLIEMLEGMSEEEVEGLLGEEG